MALTTNSDFNNMLNDYLTYDLLKENMVKKDYLLSKVAKDDGWKNGPLIVPFMAAGASSMAMGSLTDESDVSQDKPVRGEVANYKELTGTLIFNHKDLIQHDGKIKEKSFLKILPDTVDDFTNRMKSAASIMLLNGPHIAKVTADAGTTTGVIEVDRPERFEIGQKIVLKDATPNEGSFYIIAIDIDNKKLTVSNTRGGSASNTAASGDALTTFDLADTPKIYIPGAQTAANQFTSLRDQLLSSANGGSATLFGQTKASYPYLQAINVSGTAINATNILSKIFDAFITCRKFGKGNPTDALMDYKNLGAIMKLVELSKGAYRVAEAPKASIYGWTEIEIVGVKGALKCVGIQEMDQDVIMLVDWSALKFHSNGFFRKQVTPDGNQYYVKRATTGYQYLLDMFLFGDLVCSRPSYCGIIHSIPDYSL